ncbi:arsinothricin resistance N-acetyltransferase ArsN1 family B [Mycolicibacterium sp. ELW1]|uniref:arsinothricin resistance N-acetyltransferase ArsN1 family B n=1 Tax=Mycobacteriaceae TaxID=1762 RepID=UPI0011ED5DD4|nr:arsinothricin resistance N-acetyltransferase ArsN1 family B [Mycobacterium sp. ELW1]QEN14523.1 N-acetyltransferase family protein [Mycobacterium sp. ELW1]
MATAADADAIAHIYAPYVRDTVISFELTPPTAQEMAARLTTTLEHFPWLVVTDADHVVGYAYAGPHRSREAYRWCAEVSLYFAASAHRRGHGRRAYTALVNVLAAQGYINAYAGIALPNAASVGLHEALGFSHIGTYERVGFKMGKWWDVGWWHRPLCAPPERPADPRPWSELPADVVAAALA